MLHTLVYRDQQGSTDGHLAVKRYLNIGQGVKITPTGEEMRKSLFLLLKHLSSIAN